MLICIPDVLSRVEIDHCRSVIEGAQWEDGKITAGTQSSEVKENAQLPLDSSAGEEIGNLILDRLSANELFISAALPARIMPPMFNRYGVGQTFGTHVDNSIRRVRGTSLRIRTDVSATLFLCEPDEYDGGELTIETNYGGHQVKLPAGHMVLYPSTSLHMVAPVTRGVRLASFFWIQSMVRDEGSRTILFDLDQTIQGIAAASGSNDPSAVRLMGIYHNLIRKWAET